MSVNDPHDKYFRAVMQHTLIAKQFLHWFLPKHIKDILDWDSLSLSDNTYVDASLNKSISDVVFDCRYQLKDDSDEQFQHSKIVILIEHQSSPERFMPIRVYNYFFALLNRFAQDDAYDKNTKLLPAIYPMVFYHGKTKRYPYSMNVLKCVENPMNIMQNLSLLDVQLINVNELTESDTERHGLAGIMTDAMRRIPPKNTELSNISVFSRLGKIAQSIKLPRDFTKSTVKYMINVKSVDNFEHLIETSESLTNSIKGDIMTIAEQLEKRGEKRGALKTKIEMAINLLKEGLDMALIVRTTNLEPSKIKELEAELTTELKQ